MPTAFHDDGALDRSGVAALVDAYGEAGVDGFAVLTVAGEAALLAALVTTDATHIREQLGALAALGPPLLVEDHPAATGVRIAREQVAALVTELAVAALAAEAPPTPDLIATAVAAGAPPCLGGLCALYLLEELEAGAAGCMAGLATPERLVEVVRTWQQAEPARAREAYLQLAGWLRLEAMPGSVGLAVRKEAWRQRGVIGSSRIRRGQPLGATTKVAITRRLQELGVATPGGVVLG